MAPIDRVEELRAMLQERNDWHVWVLEFGITHFQMRLAFHLGTYPRYTNVWCVDCLRFEGDIQGGPYRLVLRSIEWHGTSMWDLRSTDNSFRLVFGRVSEVNRRD